MPFLRWIGLCLAAMVVLLVAGLLLTWHPAITAVVLVAVAAAGAIRTRRRR